MRKLNLPECAHKWFAHRPSKEFGQEQTGDICNWATSHNKSAHALILCLTRMKLGAFPVDKLNDVFVSFLQDILGYHLNEQQCCLYANARPKPCKVCGWCIYTGSSDA